MTSTPRLIQEIEKLPPMERIKIIDTVLRDLMRPDDENAGIWAEEAAHRWKAYTRGELQPVSYEQVMAKYRG